ncbi:MAG: FIST C-terminal domain-containing protein [Oceanospirillum sp.]|nr:FIST C-terminal domain-containing protein [Oceanospirillum sp.]
MQLSDSGFIEVGGLPTEEQSTRIANALQNLSQAGVTGISCWLAESNADLVPVIQQQCRQLNLELVGAIFPALIDQACLKDTGCLIRLLPASSQTLLVSCANQSVDAITATLDQFTIPESSKPNLFLIFDAQQPNISDILDQTYLKLHNSVRYSGTNAGSETFQPMPCLFDRDQQIGYGFWAILYDTAFSNALAHGYKNFETITATSTTGNRIHSINWRNAFEVYQEEIAKRYGQQVTAENFYDFASHFPFGIIRMKGQPLVRIPVAVEADGTLACVGDIPEHTVISLLQGVEANETETLDLLTRQLNQHAPEYQVFYCAGRRMHLGAQTNAELEQLALRLPQSGISGALSLGEICNDEGQGYPLFHNAAIICCPWA